MESHTEGRFPTENPWLALSMVMTVLIAITVMETTNYRCQATGSLQRCATSAHGGAAVAWISLTFQATRSMRRLCLPNYSAHQGVFGVIVYNDL